MNITTFYPAVFVDDMDAALTKYEDMGFSRIHTLESGYFTLHVMKLNDCRLDIFTSDMKEFRMEEGSFAMRLNVRDFEEGISMCKGLGYKMVIDPVEEPSFQLAIMDNEIGNRVFLFHHIKTSFSFSD